MPGLRDAIKALSPTWLQSGNAEKFLYIIGLSADVLLEKLNQGIRLRMPGYGDASALPLIGNDRLIGQGLSETSAQYAARLKLWLDDWQHAGSSFSILQQILGLLAQFSPGVRTVTDTNAWDYYPPNTSASTTPPTHFKGINTWNWDNEAWDPSVGAAWWRWWLILNAGTTVAGGSITAATTATPIAITTSSPHGLNTGAQVVITGVNGLNGANGTISAPGGLGAPWTITVTGANTFTLNGSFGSGTYTSGGTVYALGPNTWAVPEGSWGDGAVYGDTGPWGFQLAFSLYSSTPSSFFGNTTVTSGFTSAFAAAALTTIKVLRSTVGLWKGAHSWCRWIIINFDTGLFDPAQTADGVHNPAGTFAHWGKVSGSQYIPARFANAAYCDGQA